MSLKKKFFRLAVGFESLIAISIFNGCGESPHHKIILEYTTDANICPNPAWFYTDILKNYQCNAFDNYGSGPAPSLEVVGLCTTVITNLTTPNVYKDVFKNNIVVDCASGALTSFDFITFPSTDSSPLRVNPDPSLVLENADVGDLISIKVACYNEGFKRDSREFQFQMPNVDGYTRTCLTGH